jgi:hypothetical protein
MRRAQLHTESSNPEIVAAALVPDNTREMKTQVADGTIETTVTRETTGGLRSTVDDYIVNLSVAERITQIASETNSEDNQTTTETQ